MDGLIEDPNDLFPQVFDHLREVDAQPATKILNDELLRRADRALDAHTPRDLLWRILKTGEDLLKILQQDPKPLTRLLEITVQLIPFDELRSVISAEKLEEGLCSSSAPIQLLCLAYLQRASALPSGASFVACSPSLVKTLVTTMLASENTDVADRSLTTVVALLAVDSPDNATVVLTSDGPDRADGHGLLRRIIFHDSEIYSLLFRWTSLVRSDHDLETEKGRQAVTISQARLFAFLLKVAASDWTAISTTRFPDIERGYRRVPTTTVGSQQRQQSEGLLEYAANYMIDSKDTLMETLRQHFLTELLGILQEGKGEGATARLRAATEADVGNTNGDHV